MDPWILLVIVACILPFLRSPQQGGVLVDRHILRSIEDGSIVIRPFQRERLGTNSYDVRLAPVLRTYSRGSEPLDSRLVNTVSDIEIPEEGYVLQPGVLYLASTIEYTESMAHVPIINGKSSLGRLGLSIHVTAGTGDCGFRGHWTLEMTVVEPLRVYPGMPIGQLLWLVPSGTPEVLYHRKASAKYTNGDSLPQPSAMWKNFRARAEEDDRA